ncbi:DUF3797 domain-containing protein [Clostridium butyricum]|uniref:DUF3797 domain-containing protein n=1 Tax=Clostridium butyricum TaxID=1492 RepID=UPI000903D33F|nr:DUF3797 domain-containing protein [Clostridium butyricum]APF21458.1 hypothetical protein NPD4_3508 [Clostridium butyricum]
MLFDRTLDLMNKYGKCPECGNGEGKLLIDEDVFTRECKCGWSIKIDDSNKSK